MIKTICSAITTIALLSSSFFAKATIEIGSPMPIPSRLMKSTTGEMVSLDKVKARNGLIVMFSCNTCPFVVKSQERTLEMIELAKAKGFGFIIINSNEGQRKEEDSFEEMIKYAEQQRYSVPYVLDEHAEMADRFGAKRTPEVFLFNAQGILAYTGAMDDNPANPKEAKIIFLRKAMDAVMVSKPCEPSVTKSIGCGIKRVAE